MEEGGAVAGPQPGGQTGKESLLEPEQGCWRGRHKSRVTATHRDLTSLFCQPVYSWRSPQAKPQKEGKSREAVLRVHTRHTPGKRAGEEGACRGWGTVPSSTEQSQSPAACSRGSIPWAAGPSFVRSSFSVPNTDLRKQCYMPAMSGRTERGKAGAAHRWEDTVGRLKCERGQTSLPLHANSC